MADVILDVRERDEYRAEHVANSINLPLSELPHAAPGILQHLSGKTVAVMCLSGKRAQMALDQIANLGLGKEARFEVYQGGIQAWKKSGLPTVGRSTARLPIFRQVLIAAGALVLLFSSLGFLVSNVWFFGVVFVGAGLVFAGVSGFCLMGEILARAPWNQ